MYIFDVNPVPEPRMTQRDKWSPSPQAARYYAYKEELGYKANRQGFRIGKIIDVIFLIPMPESWNDKKRQQMIGKSHEQKPDTDNLLKAFCDALTNDDSTIWSKFARKFWWHRGFVIVTKNENISGDFVKENMNKVIIADFEEKLKIPQNDRISTFLAR